MSLLSDALARLGQYNLNPFKTDSNPFGLTGTGGTDTNLEPMLGDMVTVSQSTITLCEAAADAADATAADRLAVAADALAVHSDRIATDADAQATAADRLAVAQDKTAAADSASAASTSATLAGQYANAAGGSIPSVRLTWDIATADADPGNGKVRLNNATATAATALYVDNLDANGAAITTVLDRWTASTNTVKGTLRIAHRTDATKWLEYQVTGTVVDGTGYRKFSVTGGTGPGGFAAGDPVAVGFSRAGDAGVTPGGDVNATPDTLAKRRSDGGLQAYAMTLIGAAPNFVMNESDAPANSKSWVTLVNGNVETHYLMNDAGDASTPIYSITRSGMTLVGFDFKIQPTVNGAALAGGEDTAASIAAAATVNLGSTTAKAIKITAGTGPITAWGTAPAGAHRDITFATAVTLTHNSTSAILVGGGNITTVAGDTCRMESLGSGNWKMLSYQRASGYPLGTATSQSLSPSDKSSNATLSNVNTTVVTADGGIASGRGVAAMTTPVYWEVVVNTIGTNVTPGIASAAVPLTDYITNSATGYGYLSSGLKANSASAVAFGASYAGGDRLCFAYNPTSRNFWMGKVVGGVAVWGGSGDPVAGTNPAYTTPVSTPMYPAYSVNGSGSSVTFAFGSGQQVATSPSGFAAFG